MATFGTLKEGVDNILINAYTGLELILYTDGFNQFDRDSVLADFTEPSDLDSDELANGYGSITLSGTWASTGGVITYDHGGGSNPTFTNSGATEAWQAVYGAAISDGTYVLHFKDFGTSYTVDVGESLEVDISTLVS